MFCNYLFDYVLFNRFSPSLKFSDFGFDPLRLGEVPENLERYKESELIHCRWAMLAVVYIYSPSLPLYVHNFNIILNINDRTRKTC